MKSCFRALDYIFLVRPILLFPGWATMLAGYFAAEERPPNLWPGAAGGEFLMWNKAVVLALAAFGCAMGGSFVLNQLRDLASDRKNNKLFILGNGFIPISHGYGESLLLLATSLVVGVSLGEYFFTVLSVFILITGYLYNYPPFVLKSHPIRGMFANMAMGWLAFLLGWLVVYPPGLTMVWSSLPYLSYNTALYLLTTLPDIEGDATTGKITFPVKYGLLTTLRSSCLLMTIALILAVYLNDGFLLAVAMMVFPFFLRMIWVQKINTVVVAVKMGILFLALAVCLKFPPFLGLMSAAYGLSRFYYKRRFGLEYPTFRGR